MNIALWIAQVLLALDIIVHGWTMWFPPKKPQMGMTYFVDLPTGLQRFIGTAEILVGAGLVLPGLTGVLPWLTPLAAIGVIIIMLGAIIYHIWRKDHTNIGIYLIQIAMAVFIAYGRSTPVN
jgi:uncharacterized membrane protein YphA (DoxX/SURF4 family)